MLKSIQCFEDQQFIGETPLDKGVLKRVKGLTSVVIVTPVVAMRQNFEVK